MGRTQQVQAKNGKGEELAISTHDTDSPILPVAQIEKLNAFRPDLVDFIRFARKTPSFRAGRMSMMSISHPCIRVILHNIANSGCTNIETLSQ